MELPAETPCKKPVDAPIVATAGVLLLHVPPPASVKVVLDPAQTAEGPIIEDGKEFTVTTVVVMQPVEVSV